MRVTQEQLRRIIRETIKRKLDEATPTSLTAEEYVASLTDDERVWLRDAVSACWGSQLSDLERLLPGSMQDIVTEFIALCDDLMAALEPGSEPEQGQT